MPSISEGTAGVAQDWANGFVVVKTANFTVASTDTVLNAESLTIDASTNVTVGATATIPPNSTLALPIGFVINFCQGITGTLVVTAGAGVTLVGRSATVAASTGVTAIQVALNKWFLI